MTSSNGIFRRNSGAVRNSGALLGASALLALAGCGGGSGSVTEDFLNNSGLTSVNLTALTSDNRLVRFNSRTPGTSVFNFVSGLTAGDRLRSIDNRFTPPANLPTGDFNGNTGLFAIGQNGTTQQLYRLQIGPEGSSVLATAVGARFSLVSATPQATAFGFDFNPTVDRIRVVEPTSNRNFRLNPNTGGFVDGDPVAAGVQGDGALAYDASDPNNGKDPDGVSAAYTNSDSNPTTGTTLYVLDAANDKLTIQGRADNAATPDIDETVGPNLGRLFTVANLSIDISPDGGFDISPTGNAAFVSNGTRIYGLNLATGAASGGQRLNLPTGVTVIGLTATS